MTVEKWIQMLIPIISIVLAVVSAGTSYYFTKKQQVLADERRLKEKFYLNYIDAVSNSVVSNHMDKARDQLANAQNQLLLVGSSDVVRSLMVFHDYVKSPTDDKTFDIDKHDELLTDLIEKMRTDLYKTKSVNRGYPIIHLTGKAHKK